MRGLQKGRMQSPEARESSAFLSYGKKASAPGAQPTQGPGGGDEGLAIIERIGPNWDFSFFRLRTNKKFRWF